MAAEAAAAKAQPKTKAKAKPKPKPNQPTVTRAELVRGVFDTFDRDCDDLLNPVELRKFADSVGFEGDEQDWVEWYRDTCAEVGANRKLGVDRAQFMKLIQDADDEDLVRLCGKRKPQVAVRHAQILRSIFDLFDRDCDGLLNRVELRRFMDNVDFEGDDIEWDERYFRECKEVGANPQNGVDRSQFADVATRSCTDAELDCLLKELESMNDMPIALDVWSKLQPRKRVDAPAEDEADMKPGEELVQSKEPKPPERTSSGIPIVSDLKASPTPKAATAQDILDVDEYELDNLRKQLVLHNDPKFATKIRFQSLDGAKEVKAN